MLKNIHIQANLLFLYLPLYSYKLGNNVNACFLLIKKIKGDIIKYI